MARTINGRRTGRAAVIERHEMQNAIIEADYAQRRAIAQAEIDLLQQIRDLLPNKEWDEFADWWDDDKNVPAIGSAKERRAILEAKLAEVQAISKIKELMELQQDVNWLSEIVPLDPADQWGEARLQAAHGSSL